MWDGKGLGSITLGYNYRQNITQRQPPKRNTGGRFVKDKLFLQMNDRFFKNMLFRHLNGYIISVYDMLYTIEYRSKSYRWIVSKRSATYDHVVIFFLL